MTLTENAAMAMFREYEATESLGKAGAKYGLTRERVRQIFHRLDAEGKIKYLPLGIRRFATLRKEWPKKRLLTLIMQHGSARKAAEAAGLPIFTFNRLCHSWDIDLNEAKLDAANHDVLAAYKALCAARGGKKSLSSYQLTRDAAGRALLRRITGRFGSFHKFIKEHNIKVARAAYGSMVANAVPAGTKKRRTQGALHINRRRRAQILAAIAAQSGSATSATIAEKLNLPLVLVRTILHNMELKKQVKRLPDQDGQNVWRLA